MHKKSNIFKISLILLAFGLFVLSCNSSNDKNNNIGSHNINGIAEIKFDTTYHNFGSLIQGEQASFTFKFENTGTADLIINDAYSTCGCTIPTYSKEPIAPGTKGKIEVVFDSAGKRGVQYKTVVLKLNTKIKEKSLAIKANVVEK